MRPYYITENYSIYRKRFPLEAETDCKIEKWLLHKIPVGVWVHMIRVSYLEHCRVIKHYYIEKRASQEAQIFLPLVLGGGKIKYFSIPLYMYHFELPETHHSYSINLEWADEKVIYTNACIYKKNIIKFLPISEQDKQRLCNIAEIFKIKRIYFSCFNSDTYPEEKEELLKELTNLVNLCFSPAPNIPLEHIDNPDVFFAAIEDNILGEQPKNCELKGGRVIAWGTLGQNGRAIIPLLKGTCLDPTELWDAAGDGTTVKKPDLTSLTCYDIVLVFPSTKEIFNTILEALKGTKCNKIMTYNNILSYLAAMKYPQFYDGSIKFKG